MTNNLSKAPDEWTLALCKAEAQKYSSRTEFKVKAGTAYNVAYRNGWLDTCCTHMPKKKRNNGYWTKRRCEERAKQCETRKEFSERFTSAYSIASRNGWLETICGHMEPQGNLSKRCIYAYEFPDKRVYIGLTWNPDERNKSHEQKGPVFEHKQKSGFDYDYKVISDFVDEKEAGDLEGFHIRRYEANGWTLLNSRKAGALGGIRRTWSKNACKEAVKDCSSKAELKQKYPGAYNAMQRMKWLRELTSHLPSAAPNRYSPFWTLEKCNEEAKKYKYRSVFGSESPSAYEAARKNGWLDHICAHMSQKKPKSRRASPRKWTNQACKKAAAECSSKKEFKEKYPGAFDAAYKKGWIKDICTHMKPMRKPKGYWTRSNCQLAARKCKSISEFQSKYSWAYVVSKKENWIDDICAHMTSSRKPKGYWTKSKCRDEALKYKSRSDFNKKSSPAYHAAIKNGWLDEICSHMETRRNAWTKDKLNAIAKNYTRVADFRRENNAAYVAAHRQGCFDEVCGHMEKSRQPKGYWTKERIKNEMEKYATRTEFNRACGGAAIVAHGYGWYDELWNSTHMVAK